MKIDQLEQANDKVFRRITGVKRKTFEFMVNVLTEEQVKKRIRGGRPNKLSIAEMLLMTLEYLREYRTYAHIGISYGLSESNAYQTIRWVENTLISRKEFHLPGKKALLKSENEYEVVLIDVTETPIERPKKNKKNLFLARKNVTLSKHKL
jgi:Helix-turn-helix of DDE superfamily endonuclease